MRPFDEVNAKMIGLGPDGGAFHVRLNTGAFRVVASFGLGWDHVSVSRSDRCPTWDEMCQIKRRFFRDDETVMQLHVPPHENINMHPYCLHLWRPQDVPIPRPPAVMV